ncbi:hypothetical protein DMENIID0001_093350 [Sergentomyia squamirostris]
MLLDNPGGNVAGGRVICHTGKVISMKYHRALNQHRVWCEWTNKERERARDSGQKNSHSERVNGMQMTSQKALQTMLTNGANSSTGWVVALFDATAISPPKLQSLDCGQALIAIMCTRRTITLDHCEDLLRILRPRFNYKLCYFRIKCPQIDRQK